MKHQVHIITYPSEAVLMARFEGKKLTYIKIFPPQEASQLGAIYLGKAVRVLDNLQAAFIAIGSSRDGFLSRRDAQLLADDPALDNDIEACIEEGDEVLVQITRMPIGDKSPQLTADVSFSGQFLVFTPCRELVCFSRSIDEKERKRLGEIIQPLADKLGEPGWLLRTAAIGVSEEVLQGEMNILYEKWQALLEEEKEAEPPALLSTSGTPLEQALHEAVRASTETIYIEGKAGFEALKAYSEKRLPHALPLLQLGEGAHKAHDFDHIMNSLSSPKIKLASGAWLMIEETEAMVSIDVNSGSATEKTPLAINLEAVPEIAEQLSLRSLGGLIAIDFVDMEKEEEREKLINSLRDEFENSPTPNRIADISPFGVVEMTRKRPGLSWKEQAKWLDE